MLLLDTWIIMIPLRHKIKTFSFSSLCFIEQNFSFHPGFAIQLMVLLTDICLSRGDICQHTWFGCDILPIMSLPYTEKPLSHLHYSCMSQKGEQLLGWLNTNLWQKQFGKPPTQVFLHHVLKYRHTCFAQPWICFRSCTCLIFFLDLWKTSGHFVKPNGNKE